MPCPNATQVLNALELRILDAVDADSKHVVIVGAGDGGLARAIQKHVSDTIDFTLIEPKESLRPYLTDFETVGSDPFDVAWLKDRVAEKGTIDQLIFYNIHDYWNGNLRDFRDIANLLSDTGNAWVSFLNGAARNVMLHFLPRDVVNYGGLAQPAANAAHMTYGSWVSCLNMMDCHTDQTWALLDPETYEFVQTVQKSEGEQPPVMDIELKGMSMKVASLQDAFLYGGMFVAIQFSPRTEGKEKRNPRYTAAAFSSPLYQALLVPYPDNSLAQVSDFLAETEVEAWRRKETKELNPIGKLLLEELRKTEGLESVLVLGAGWGRDLSMLTKELPDLTITGLDASRHKVELGAKVFGNGEIDLRCFDPEKELPFEESSYDLIITTGFLCHYHVPVSHHIITECARVAKRSIYHLEDARGPVQSLQLKSLSIVPSYKELGYEDVTLKPIAVGEKHTGFVISKTDLKK